ncbi:MAG: L,D-transpeptidase [Ardenticatenales bacterium]|nr:L,D-transpeptidase [Ardenticatenales bacterium]
MRYRVIPLLFAFLLAITGALSFSEETQAAGRMREVGGYGLVLRDSPTFAYGSLDSAVNGQIKKGQLVYINGWQIGVYHIGSLRWVAAASVQPIIDANGNPLVNYVSRQGSQYYMNGQAIQLPGRYLTEAEKFLANPDINAPITYQGGHVAEDVATEVVDTSAVRFASGEAVAATMRVTNVYNFIYLRTEPREDAPQVSYYAYPGEILTAYEVVGDRWYRIAPNVWAPRTWGNDVLLVPENVAGYAPAEYYNGGKWISIDLARQRLTAWEGNDIILSTPVKSGKYGYSTPTGVWKTYEKIPSERMSGSDYDLKDVAWTQYFTRNRIAIHAAYWHNNYNGRPGSHGCVNIPPDKAKVLFMWAPVGTTIVAHNAYVYDAQDIRDAQKWNQYNR